MIGRERLALRSKIVFLVHERVAFSAGPVVLRVAVNLNAVGAKINKTQYDMILEKKYLRDFCNCRTLLTIVENIFTLQLKNYIFLFSVYDHLNVQYIANLN